MTQDLLTQIADAAPNSVIILTSHNALWSVEITPIQEYETLEFEELTYLASVSLPELEDALTDALTQIQKGQPR